MSVHKHHPEKFKKLLCFQRKQFPKAGLVLQSLDWHQVALKAFGGFYAIDVGKI